MPDVIIKIEDLSKVYLIGHQRQERYTALRDVLAEGARNIGRKFLHPWRAADSQPGFASREEFYALRDVNIEIQRGDRIGIIGRNGAGKSTLLKILSRITEPSRGCIEIDGRVASLLEVGTGFHPELTGRENIFLNGAILGMTRAEIRRKFDEIVAFAEVEKFLDTPVKRYSSGMYVRLAFAVAAHLEPEILIVDEVLAVGDAQFQKKCLGKMEQAGKEGRTIIFVSHDMSAVKALCSEVLILSAGEVIGRGDPDSQIYSYLQQYSAGVGRQVAGNIRLGNDLVLSKCIFNPNPLEEGADLDYCLELNSISRSVVHAMTIIIYDVIGVRLAIVDLRTDSGPYVIEKGSTLAVTGLIRGIPFIEGDYSVALYLDSGEIRNEFKNISDITVVAKSSERGFAPYSPRISGYVRLDSTFEVAFSED